MAFDLEEVGGQGSLVFVHDFLMSQVSPPSLCRPPLLQVLRSPGRPQPKFTGAIIMDCILNYNTRLEEAVSGSGYGLMDAGDDVNNVEVCGDDNIVHHICQAGKVW